MTKSETITLFRLFMDDTSELSSDEETLIYNKAYRKVFTNRPWEFAKKEHSGTTDGNNYISLPSDYAYSIQNNNYTDETTEEASRPVVYVGPNYDEYKLVSWSDRRSYRNQTNYCWVDIVNSRLYFSTTPASGLAVEFDYVFNPTEITTESGEPAVPSAIKEEVGHAIYHAMCVDNFVIQQSDKAKSYASENNQMYQSYLTQIAYYNSNLVQL